MCASTRSCDRYAGPDFDKLSRGESDGGLRRAQSSRGPVANRKTRDTRARRRHSFSLPFRSNFANFATCASRTGEHAFPGSNRRFQPASANLSPRFSGQFRMFANFAITSHASSSAVATESMTASFHARLPPQRLPSAAAASGIAVTWGFTCLRRRSIVCRHLTSRGRNFCNRSADF